MHRSAYRSEHFLLLRQSVRSLRVLWKHEALWHACMARTRSQWACLPACPALPRSLHRARSIYLHACKGSWKDGAAWIYGWIGWMHAGVCVCTAVKRGAGANDSGGRMHACMQAWHDLPAGCCCLLLQLQRRAGRGGSKATLRRAEFEADARNSASSGSGSRSAVTSGN
jgi:hypothetical protein